MTERKAANAAQPLTEAAKGPANHSLRETAPAPLWAGWRGGGAERAAFSLQRLAGNRAIAASLAEIASTAASRASVGVVGTPTSTIAAAPDGHERILATEGGFRAAGVTTLPAPGAPDLIVGSPTQQPPGQWQASIQPTSVTPDPPTSLYPGPGLHRMPPGEAGQTRHKDVTPAASDEIRRGEEEHLLDLEWARHLAYDTVAETINRVAAGPPATGATADDARRAASQAVRSALPPQAQWPDGRVPIQHWRWLYGQLVAVTRERDRPNRYHDMTTQIVLDPAEKRRLNVPVGDELQRYLAGTTKVGQHASEPEVRARYDSLATGGGGTSGGSPGAGGTPGGAGTPGSIGGATPTVAPPTSTYRPPPEE